MTFSRRDLFWYCAGVLSVLVVALLVHALNGAAPALASASAPVSAPAPPAANTSGGPKAAGTMDEVLERLETRLASQGGSDADWELLAQTYEFVGRAAEAKLARAHQLPASAHTAVPEGLAAAAASSPAPTAGITTVAGAVDLSTALKSKVPDGLTLFIVAKSVDSPGPPVAIVRTTTGRWPLPFTLDDSDAMMPGRNLSTAQRVTIEARVSHSGMATPQSGDFQSGIITIISHDAKSNPKSVQIVIDHVIG
jgi:hypothetical protein